jgi:RNA polymerase sigma factor (sigma-70 family)
MEGFEELAKQYEPMIYKIMRTLHIYKDKNEFFQLGLVGLWEAKVKFDPNKGEFTNYAFTYIKGLFLTEMAKTNRHSERMVFPKDEFWEVIEDTGAEMPFEAKLLLSYCESLSVGQTKWVLYTCVDGLSVREIAAKEGVSVSAVKMWRNGAKRKLRESLRNVE